MMGQSRAALLGLLGGVVSLRRSEVLVSLSFSPIRLELPVVQQMRRLPAELLGEE
jgi:hypothetical protein